MRFLLAIGALVLASVTTNAQTTGAPNLNDYCIGPFVSGSTSCTPVVIPGGGATTLNIDARTSGLPVFIFVALLPGSCPAPALTFVNTTCGGGLVQSLDIIPGTFPPFVCTTGAGGSCIIPVTLPAGISFATQAVVLDPTCGVPAFGPNLRLLFTQAYQVFT